MLYTAWYFIKTRIIYLKYHLKVSFLQLPKRIIEELALLDDGEDAGRVILTSRPETFAVIIGHTHHPREIHYPNGQMYVNTGTWMKMINLDLRYFGRSIRQPFCMIAYPKDQKKPQIFLLEWKGPSSSYRHFIP